MSDTIENAMENAMCVVSDLARGGRHTSPLDNDAFRVTFAFQPASPLPDDFGQATGHHFAFANNVFAPLSLEPDASPSLPAGTALPAGTGALDDGIHTVAVAPAESLFDAPRLGVSFHADVNQNRPDEDEDDEESQACPGTGVLDNNVHSAAVVSSSSPLPANQPEFHGWFQEGFKAFLEEEEEAIMFHLHYTPWTSEASRLLRPLPPQKPPPPAPTAIATNSAEQSAANKRRRVSWQL